MKIQLIAVGNRMPGWVSQGYEEYARRLSRECILELVEIAPGRRGKGDARNAMAEEGERMRKAIPGGWRVVAMEVTGRSWTTEKLAERCAFWQQDARDVALLVGGPEGLAPECQALAEERWSLSPLTLPHPLVRVIVAEQLYRAWSILNNHPYHRA